MPSTKGDLDPSHIQPGRDVAVEDLRLTASRLRTANWKRWGPYLSDRQWGTVREDYSPHGDAWNYFSHDQARSRAYRWGEDGLLGWTDRQCRLCFSMALWNGRDSILKERLFGLTNGEGNHGEDVKECYYFLDSSPTHSYCKALYKYPQKEFPYEWLVAENRSRSRQEREFELIDTGVFDESRYFDVFVEYAKSNPDDILIRITAANRGPESAELHLIPTVWFRNTWAWGNNEGDGLPIPWLAQTGAEQMTTWHPTLGQFDFLAPEASDGTKAQWLFTDNETDAERLFGKPNRSSYVKDAFHRYIINGEQEVVNSRKEGTKGAAWYKLQIPAGESRVLTLRLRCRDVETLPVETETELSSDELPADGVLAEDPIRRPVSFEGLFGDNFEAIFKQRQDECDAFYACRLDPNHTLSEESLRITRQAYAGLMWCKQFYHLSVKDWLRGDPWLPPPPQSRLNGRNSQWGHLYNRDIVSMPDTWEYPWYAAWDLAFHMIPLCEIDPDFAKEQLNLLLREWYMHPNGQIPAYEYNFSDVNPPVHAWACWRVYKMSATRGHRDLLFLKQVFHKLLINFTWWVNRKDVDGRHLFSGGFLGLDNIGVFDRSQPLPEGKRLEQADGTAWMAFYCSTMLAIALELARFDSSYEDIASKFLEHFVAIVDAMNSMGGFGLWDDEDGFYYDVLRTESETIPMRLRSMVGLIPLFAVEVLDEKTINQLPGFRSRMNWYLSHYPDLARHIVSAHLGPDPDERAPAASGRQLLAIPPRDRLERVLKYLLDDREFLSPYGIRSMSQIYREKPYEFDTGNVRVTVEYEAAESTSDMFGGNSNWRGPVWFPLNYLLVEALERYYHFYGDTIRVEFPTGSGNRMNLLEISQQISRRLTRLFLPDERGARPLHGSERQYADDPHWKDLVLFYEYFDGDIGRGLGASHQTGWTALVTRFLESEPLKALAPDPRAPAQKWSTATRITPPPFPPVKQPAPEEPAPSTNGPAPKGPIEKAAAETKPAQDVPVRNETEPVM